MRLETVAARRSWGVLLPIVRLDRGRWDSLFSILHSLHRRIVSSYTRPSLGASTMSILAALFVLAQQIPTFKEQVVDPDVGVGYALTVADINGDGKQDIVVVTEIPDQVVWYENPT